MNKWKIGFWICFVTLLVTVGLGMYSVIEHGVSLTYMRQGYDETENDLKGLMKIINETNLTKKEITDLVISDKKLEFVNDDGDKITLGNITLTFEEDRLKRIDRAW